VLQVLQEKLSEAKAFYCNWESLSKITVRVCEFSNQMLAVALLGDTGKNKSSDIVRNNTDFFLCASGIELKCCYSI
jgi:hypothetical protein